MVQITTQSHGPVSKISTKSNVRSWAYGVPLRAKGGQKKPDSLGIVSLLTHDENFSTRKFKQKILHISVVHYKTRSKLVFLYFQFIWLLLFLVLFLIKIDVAE